MPKPLYSNKKGKTLAQLRVPEALVQRMSAMVGEGAPHAYLQDLYAAAVADTLNRIQTGVVFARAPFRGREARTLNLWLPDPLVEAARAEAERLGVAQVAIYYTALCDYCDFP